MARREEGASGTGILAEVEVNGRAVLVRRAGL